MPIPHDDAYGFRRVAPSDLPLLNGWLKNKHVAEWWDAEPYDLKDLSDPRVALWLVEHRGVPFAFMQDYDPHGWERHHFGHLATGARGVDQFIGEPDMLGHGHGRAFIAQRARALMDAGAPVVATDPHPDNARAIAVYAKIGFKASAPPLATQWGLILPMLLHRPGVSSPTPPPE
jgi:aminoglycoside 6'-N-acetyltransferase